MSSVAATRLARIRSLLAKNSLAAYIVPSADAHQSEYTAPCDKRRDFITGFTGSAGTAVITPSDALLWTDGRYFLQAERELDSSCWKLMKQGIDGVPTIPEWLSKNVTKGGKVAYDPYLISLSQRSTYADALTPKGIDFAPLMGNLVDAIWPHAGGVTICGSEETEYRPALPSGKIIVQKVEYAGATVADKLSTLRVAMQDKGAYAVVVTALDEIAWLYNLRGSDIDFNPVFMSYAIVTLDGATLFANAAQFDGDVASHLASAGVAVRPYSEAVAGLTELSAVAAAKQAEGADAYKIWTDAKTATVAVEQALLSSAKPGVSLLDSTATPITLAKGIKNDAELAGMKRAHIEDAAAVSKFLAWLEQQLPSLPKATDSAEAVAASPLNEFTASEKLESFRAQGKTFVSLSFDTISSIGPNGAVIHYKPDEKTSSPLTTGKVYLLDSGGQYVDGTTDITRTVFLARPGTDSTVGETESDGAPSEFQRRAFTRVLQGHISLSAQTFPPNTMGPALDALARQFLWKDGLNYLHGTGHGVGAFLNVHEGPQGIAMMNRGGAMCSTPIVPGMVLSNEPGYYHDGEFGIRIENLVYCVSKETRYAGSKYYGFENLTFVPMDRRMIDVSLLSADELAWLNAYHAECLEKVKPLLEGDEVTTAWLEKNCAPITV